MKLENGFQWRRSGFNDLNFQALLVCASFFKGPNCSDPCHGILITVDHGHTRLSAVPVAPDGYLPIFLLLFARSKVIAFGIYKKPGHLERMPRMGVEVEVRLGVEGPVKELEGIGTGDKGIGVCLERSKRDGVVEVS